MRKHDYDQCHVLTNRRSAVADCRSDPAAGAVCHEKHRIPTEILIPGSVDPGVRDSLGRGRDAGSTTAVVAADRSVQRGRESLPQCLLGA